MNGKVVIFSAPSGAGKTTIAKELLKRIPSLEFSISATSREKRTNETEGVDYYFLSIDEFKKKIEKKEFLEYQEVYTDIYYGTLQSEVERIWGKNKNIMFDVDAVGGLNIKNIYRDKALAVFIEPPSVKHLEERLIARRTETQESLKKRMERAQFELDHANKFDKIIVNDDLQTAIDEAVYIVTNFLNNKS